MQVQAAELTAREGELLVSCVIAAATTTASSICTSTSICPKTHAGSDHSTDDHDGSAHNVGSTRNADDIGFTHPDP